MDNVLSIATASWALVMALSPLLQIKRILANRSSHDVSVGYFYVLCIGFGLWIAYGFSKKDLVLILPNCVALVIALTTIVIAHRFRDGSPNAA